MRSTLLFLAVLLACTPVQTHAAAPPEPPILTAWLTALLPAATIEATRETVAKRKKTSAHPQNRQHVADLPPVETAPRQSATLLTHDSNAP